MGGRLRFRRSQLSTLIICGDEDDACVEPSLFLKTHLSAAGLTALNGRERKQ
jgi:hypothetical protein